LLNVVVTEQKVQNKGEWNLPGGCSQGGFPGQQQQQQQHQQQPYLLTTTYIADSHLRCLASNAIPFALAGS